MSLFTAAQLYHWCSIPYTELEDHAERKVPFRLCKDATEMSWIMARELLEEIRANNERGSITRAIIPCGPRAWCTPFAQLVNRHRISLKRLVVFHMDECLNWQGRELPRRHPYNLRAYMEDHFYAPVDADLAVPEENRYWPTYNNIEEIRERIEQEQVDITYGGWGQDGHIAYNQARRHPFSHLSVEELRESTVRIQENNFDTILALAHRTFGTAYQFVPPMSVTLGMRECLSARKVRIFNDVGSWKQTALRVALFGPLTPEYPITLLQEHPDALLTATIETASHPISEHPEWDLGV